MKQMKVLGVIAMALTLGLTACGGPNQKTCKHKWGDWEVVTAETCTTDGLQKRTCTVCKLVEEKKINKGHKWGSWETVTASTCTVQGDAKRTCSRCNEVETKKLDLAPHTPKVDAEGNEIIEWETEPTCEAAGVGGHRTCSVCGAEIAVSSSEAAALGHNFHKDDEGKIVFTWTTAPSCELPGVGTKHCDRCGKDIAATDEERAKLGHDVEAIGGETTPTDGTAAVRLYHCKRCDQTFMGFLANEVTNDSKAHVKFEPETVTEGQEQGARFLGRPIGNALALDANGTSVNQKNGECVYCSTETGDFIEYAFRLNAEQAATLASCRMYVDAKPADYLNGTDFWAYSGSNDEWTPGYYIDGGDERFEKNTETGEFVMVQDHEKAGFDSQQGADKVDAEGNPVMVKQGKRIEDYRYVLYVDDQVKDFDPETENPTHGRDANMQREEFELPYTFSLHEGLNKIKFVMAGGYRSLFYKCIFRPYVAPTPVTVANTELEVREGKTVQIESTMTGLQYASSSNSVATVDANGLVTGVKAGKATITVSKDGNYKPAKVQVTVLEKEGIVNIDLLTGVVAPEGGIDIYNSSYNGVRLRNFTKDATITYAFQAELDGEYDIQLTGSAGGNIAETIAVKVNDVDVALSGELGGSTYSPVNLVIGQAAVAVGANTLEIKCIAESTQLVINGIKLFPHVHVWGEKQEVAATEGCVAYDKYECQTCHRTKIEVKLDDSMLASGSVNKNDPAGYMKLKSNNQSFSFTFKYDKEATGKIYQRGVMDSWSSNKERNVFSGGSNGADDFELTVNGTKVDLSAYKSAKYKEIMKGDAQTGNLSPLTDVESGTINLVNGNNTVTYKRLASYNLALTHIVFIVK